MEESMRLTFAFLALDLVGGCEFRVKGVPIASPGSDGPPADLAGLVPPDLSGKLPIDFAGVDLTGVDLTSPPDLAAPPPDLSAPLDLTGVDLLIPGSLSVTVTTTPAGNLDLTSLGTADWAHWGLNQATDFDHKLTGSTQISNFSSLKSGTTVGRLPGYPITASWSDGTPDTTNGVNPTNTGVYVNGQDAGFRVTAPADNSTRTLTIYCGGQMATAALKVSLSDGSAPDYNTTTTYSVADGDNSILMQFQRTLTIVYHSSQVGSTLTVDWSVGSAVGYVHLQSATLQ
jgi:hypothetical protein